MIPPVWGLLRLLSNLALLCLFARTQSWMESFSQISRHLVSGCGFAFHFASGKLNGFDDVLIAGAATQVSFQSVSYIGFCWVGIAVENLCSGHHHSGRAVAALQAVLLPKP